MSAPRLLVFGCLTLDNVITAEGECLPQTFGGNCLYSALGARLWSDSVGVVSRHGAGYPAAAFDLLASLGIDTGGIRRLDAPHGRNVAFAYRPDGSRSRVIPPDVAARIPPADRPRFIDSSLLPDAGARWLAYSPDAGDVPARWWESAAGLHCATMPVAAHRRIAAAARARDGRRIWVQVDSPYYEHAATAVDDATALFRDVDAVLPSEADIEAFRPDAPVTATVADWLAYGAPAVVLKLGAAGCRIYAAGRGLIAAVPVVPVRATDPTGAGDAFCGGFLAGMLASGDILTAARHGTVSASFAVETHGIGGLAGASRQAAADRLAALTHP